MTERDESCVPSVDVSGSVFRPCGRAALGSVILVVVLGEPCVDAQTIDEAPFWIDSRKVFWGRALSLPIVVPRNACQIRLRDYFHGWEGRFSASEEKSMYVK